MKERILFVWAVTASVVALSSVGVAGYLFGKNASEPSGMQQAKADTTPKPAGNYLHREPSESEGGAVVEPAYTVPDSLAELPDQWFSVDLSSPVGYAILFDPETREIIVESCEHRGYALDQTGRSQAMGQSCTNSLTGSFITLGEDEALIDSRDGREVSVSLNVDRTAAPMTLDLRFDEHRMTLVPGSKNDLMQAFEALPEIKEQRRQYLVALATGERADDRHLPGQ